MYYFICFMVAFFACIIGKICGMGGGVIIKPVLDSTGIMDVAAINFLSGVTVVGMTCWSVGKSMVRKQSSIDLSVSTPLAIGAAIGGLVGKQLFSMVASSFADKNTAGSVQAALLLIATLATLIYTLNRSRFSSHSLTNKPLCAVVGLFLGMLGTFLGIGGGPFNMAVMYFFFSMSAKTAAQNSLYVILISQSVGLISSSVTSGIPGIPAPLMAGMVLCGIIGSEAGGMINRRLDERQVNVLFELSMLLVMGISAYNIYSFLS